MAWTLMQRLREIEANWDERYIRTTVGNAADEIERLRAEIIESDDRAARLAHWLGEAEQALRNASCPRPANNRPDEFTVGECCDARECGCDIGAPLVVPVVEAPRCIICGGPAHARVCDSPGALVTGTTGCPVHDARRKELVGRLLDLAGTFAGDSTESLICNAAAAELGRGT